MAVRGQFQTSSTKVQDLTGLDPSVVGYISQLERGDVSTQGFDEKWEIGSAQCTVTFQSKEVKIDFEKKYDYYFNSLQKSCLNVQDVCKGKIQIQIADITQRRCDLCVRLIEEQVVLCGTQQVIDSELGSFEYKIMALRCDECCALCGYQGTLENTGANGVFIAETPEEAIESDTVSQQEVEKKTGMKEHSELFDTSFQYQKESKQPTKLMEEKMKVSEITISSNSDIGLYVYCADLVSLRVDALVCPVDQSMSLTRGIGKVVAQAAGSAIEKECKMYQEEYRLLNEGQAVVVTAGKLHCQYVFLVNPGYRRGDSLTEEQIKRAVGAVLDLVKNKDLSTVALPFIGTGKGGVSVSTSTKAICQALKVHLTTASPLNACHVVGQNEDQVKEAQTQARSFFLSPNALYQMTFGRCFSTAK